MIDMVTWLSIGSTDYLSMHPYNLLFAALLRPNSSEGIKRTLPRLGKPFMLCKTIKILRIDDGELAASQWDSPKRMAIA